MNSRAKGKRGERQVAALLARWWEGVEPGTQFVPTPQSGGFSTRQVRAQFKLAGDLMTTSEIFPFVVEVKLREEWSLDVLRAGKRSPVWKWWRQAQTAAEVQGGLPMLWFRKSRDVWRVMVGVDSVLAKRHPPEIRWQPADLARGVDIGKAMPVCILAEHILASDYLDGL